MNLNTNDFSPELAKTAKTEEDLQALAQEDGYELTEEQLEGVAGGRKVAGRAGHTRKEGRLTPAEQND